MTGNNDAGADAMLERIEAALARTEGGLRADMEGLGRAREADFERLAARLAAQLAAQLAERIAREVLDRVLAGAPPAQSGPQSANDMAALAAQAALRGMRFR